MPASAADGVVLKDCFFCLLQDIPSIKIGDNISRIFSKTLRDNQKHSFKSVFTESLFSVPSQFHQIWQKLVLRLGD